MTRDQILRAIKDHHVQFLDAIAGLDDDALTKHPVIDWWTIKDVMGHIAMGEHIALRFIAEYRCDGLPKILGLDSDDKIDAQNKREVTIRRDWSLARVRAEFDAAHRDLYAAVATLSDADLSEQLPAPWDKGDTLERLIAINAYQHNPEHIEQIKQWRAAR